MIGTTVQHSAAVQVRSAQPPAGVAGGLAASSKGSSAQLNGASTPVAPAPFAQLAAASQQVRPLVP